MSSGWESIKKPWAMLFFSQGNWPVCIFFYFLLCHHKKTNNNNIPEHITWQKYLKQTNNFFFVLRNFIDLVETMFIAIGVSIKIMMFKIITDGYSYFVFITFNTMLSPLCQTKLIVMLQRVLFKTFFHWKLGSGQVDVFVIKYELKPEIKCSYSFFGHSMAPVT